LIADRSPQEEHTHAVDVSEQVAHIQFVTFVQRLSAQSSLCELLHRVQDRSKPREPGPVLEPLEEVVEQEPQDQQRWAVAQDLARRVVRVEQGLVFAERLVG